MKRRSVFLIRVIAAALLLIPQTQSFREIGVYALIVTSALWILTAFFHFTRPLFPKLFFHFVLLAAVLTAGQLLWYYLDLAPFWILSLLLLLPFPILGDSPIFSEIDTSFSAMVSLGFGFSGLFSVIAFLRIELAEKIGLAIFGGPAFSFFLFGLFLLISQTLPERKYA